MLVVGSVVVVVAVCRKNATKRQPKRRTLERPRRGPRDGLDPTALSSSRRRGCNHHNTRAMLLVSQKREPRLLQKYTQRMIPLLCLTRCEGQEEESLRRTVEGKKRSRLKRVRRTSCVSLYLSSSFHPKEV